MRKVKVKKAWIENTIITLLSSVVITILLGLIPRTAYAPQTTGRGLPFAWYVKFQMEGAVPHVYWDRFFVDLIIIILLVSMVLVMVHTARFFIANVKVARAERLKQEALKEQEKTEGEAQ